MTLEEMKKEKESLSTQYQELRDRCNQVFGALMWIQQQIATDLGKSNG